MTNKVNISQIENFLYSILKGKVSNNTFVGSPLAIDKSWKDMCIIDSSSIEDFHAFGRGIVLLWLFAKPFQNGTKNVAVMNKLEERLDNVLKNYPCDKYCLSRRATDQGFEPKMQWHYNVVEIRITIV